MFDSHLHILHGWNLIIFYTLRKPPQGFAEKQIQANGGMWPFKVFDFYEQLFTCNEINDGFIL